MTNREYWLFTEVFVYLHKSDVCDDPECPHCKFLFDTFLVADEENDDERK